MKRILLIILISTTIQTLAQTDCTQTGSANCENNTHTDPNPSYTSPLSNDFKQNTFDWTLSTFPVFKPGFTMFQPVGAYSLSSPFYNSNNFLQRIAGGQNSDFSPEDGWELIKQDFGYMYEPISNKWDGANRTSNNNPLAYILLYNKYSGILRVLAAMPNNLGENKIQVNISFVLGSIDEIFSIKPIYNDFKSSGLLSNNTSYTKALDQNTEIFQVSAIAAQSIGLPEFFYADFQTSYDPCVCLFKSGLYISFSRVSYSNIIASGNIIGNDVDITNITNVNNLLYGSNSGAGSYHASFNTQGLIPKNVIHHFSSTESFMKAINSNGNNEITQLKKTVSDIGLFIINDNKIELYNAKKEYEKITKHVDFFNLPNREINTTPVAISSNLVVSGVNIPRRRMIVNEILITNPGSCDSDKKPEYPVLDGNNGAIPMYPMYNEPLGLSALLYTPRIHRTLTAEKMDDCGKCKKPNSKRCKRNCNRNSSKQVRTVEKLQEVYKLENNSIKLAFHPLIDSEKTQVDAAIEIFGIDDLVIDSNKDYFLNKTAIHCSKLDEKEGIGRYRTQFLPLECIDELVFGLGHSFFGNKNRHDEFFSKARSKSYLVLNIYYVFKEDVYGNVHTAVQTIKYPLEIIESNEDLTKHPNINVDLIKDSLCIDKPKNYITSTSDITEFCKSELYKAKEVDVNLSSQDEQKENVIIASKNIASIYPNPNNGTFTILFDKQTIVNHTLTIIDPLGRTVHTQFLERGNNSFEVIKHNLSPGVYFLSISHGCEKQTFKIVVQGF